MKRLLTIFTMAVLACMLTVGNAAATKEILTSIHGNRIGLDSDGDLVIRNSSGTKKQLTDVNSTAGEIASSYTATLVETDVIEAGPWRHVTLTATAVPFSLTDDSGVGQYGSLKLYDFPEGNLLFMGLTADGAFALTATGLNENYTGTTAMATTAVSSGVALSNTTANLLASASFTQATPVGGVLATAVNDMQTAYSTTDAYSKTGATWHDGTATAKDMYLNFHVTDVSTHTNTLNGTWTGVFKFMYMIIGDN